MLCNNPLRESLQLIRESLHRGAPASTEYMREKMARWEGKSKYVNRTRTNVTASTYAFDAPHEPRRRSVADHVHTVLTGHYNDHHVNDDHDDESTRAIPARAWGSEQAPRRTVESGRIQSGAAHGPCGLHLLCCSATHILHTDISTVRTWHVLHLPPTALASPAAAVMDLKARLSRDP
ncbi:hypothetical protein JDV02_000801 [Purpureocillium takamizusanense]|uniref:Uncharacterized protein n=1 Tax=Purpureocillium takamizusanense TaxID=2060973 RepID=A0A9Q8V779_9HYPO|nr:uncharacterized protein JDV02_000801 [Purpureocillium takamizusanense]UNI14136.1 hypothetical protein JDV02_000801 [Purpureocillium takamizusanense]